MNKNFYEMMLFNVQSLNSNNCLIECLGHGPQDGTLTTALVIVLPERFRGFLPVKMVEPVPSVSYK